MRHLALWAGLLAPPVIWLALLETNYMLAYAACDERALWFLFLTIAVALALAAAAGFAAWKMGPPAPGSERSEPWSARTREIRSRWMSMAAALFTIWFLIVTVAMTLPPLVLHPCD